MAQDVVTLIETQHRRLEQLLRQAEQQAEKGAPETTATLQQIRELLVPHSEAEEGFVYPAIRARAPKEGSEITDGTAEHHHSEQVLEGLLAEQPGTPGFDGKLAGFIGELEHHIEEEESELLPVLTKGATDAERAELAQRFAQATGWSGDTADATKDELYAKAREQGVEGRSSMTKDELAAAVEPE